MGWVRWSAKVRPVGVLELRDLAHAFERLVIVGEGEFANGDVRLIGCRGRGNNVVVWIREERRLLLGSC